MNRHSVEADLEPVHDEEMCRLFQQTAPICRLDVARLAQELEREPPKREVKNAPPRRRWAWRPVSAVITAAFVCGLLVVVPMIRPASLLAQVSQALSKSGPYRCVVTVEDEHGVETGMFYWAPPNSSRQQWRSKGTLTTETVQHSDQPGIHIDHRKHSYYRSPPMKGSPPLLSLIDQLARYRGEANRYLDRTQIRGHAADGFEISLMKIDPDSGGGLLRMWFDPETMRPIRIEFELSPPMGQMRFDEFTWEEPTDGWFALTPPAEYVDKTRTPPEVEEIAAKIIKGMTVYAKYSGGHYPRVRNLYGDVTMNEVRQWSGTKPTDWRQEMFDASQGFATVNSIQRENPDSAFYGRTVTAKDGGKILFRWKLDNGDYCAIFGDLKFEVVSSTRLQELERR